MKILNALISGFVGASTLTIAHQLLKKYVKDAPEIDVLGMQSIAKSMDKLGLEIPVQERLYKMSMAGDMISNTLYYALTATGKIPLLSGSVLGLSAGLGVISLPGPMGLDLERSAKTANRKALSVSIYLLGGIAAGACYSALKSDRE